MRKLVTSLAVTLLLACSPKIVKEEYFSSIATVTNIKSSKHASITLTLTSGEEIKTYLGKYCRNVADTFKVGEVRLFKFVNYYYSEGRISTELVNGRITAGC